jgi:hypothetical protein
MNERFTLPASHAFELCSDADHCSGGESVHTENVLAEGTGTNSKPLADKDQNKQSELSFSGFVSLWCKKSLSGFPFSLFR